MAYLPDLLANHWFTIFLVTLAGLLGIRHLLRWHQSQDGSLAPLIFIALAGLGGVVSILVGEYAVLEHPSSWSWWVSGTALTGFMIMIAVLLLNGSWSSKLGYGLGALLMFGLGGLCAKTISRASLVIIKTLSRLEALHPWWLLLLGLIPIIIWMSFRSLAGLGPVRRWLAIGLRSSLILLLTMALAEVRLRHRSENVTVLFLVDRSLSIPEDFDINAPAPQNRIDRRWERTRKFINDVVEKRGPTHRDDQAGVIVFGRRPRLEFPPSNVPRLNFKEVTSPIDNYYTDLAAALKLALATFPEGAAKRVVLISDGNQNLGNAENQARIAQRNGVQIDVLPIDYQNDTEVLVERVEALSLTAQSSQVPIRVLLRNNNPHTVVGTLTLNQVRGDLIVPVDPSPLKDVEIRPGLNSIRFKQRLGTAKESYTYEAKFQPERVVDNRGNLLPEASARLQATDRSANNSASTHVLALGKRRVLLVQPQEGDHQYLIDHLRKVGNSKFEVRAISVNLLPENKADLAVFLSNYDCVILANVAASDITPEDIKGDKLPAYITEDQQEVIRGNTYDQGCGLIMIGGPNGFGAGGWHGTPVEKALPVDCDINSIEVSGRGGLVLIMHASEMADGNRWQKEIAKLAIQKLAPSDMMGMLFYDGTHRWHIPFQEVGGKRERLVKMAERMNPGDMPDVDPALRQAYDALTDPKHSLATKHIIFISDGDHWVADPKLLATLKTSKITCTTVCITTHGSAEEQKMNSIATATGGRFYNVKSPKALPAIYIKETRVVSQSFIFDQGFKPRLQFRTGPTENLPDPLAPLFGYVKTTPKRSPLVQIPILGPPSGEQEFPILAYWQYGLGRSMAFTSDARSQPPDRAFWDRDWANSDMYLKFWEQVVDWSLRSVETGRLTMSTDFRDGKVKVVVEARDENNKPMTDLVLQGGITIPKGDADRKPDLKFEQKNSGIYEAEFRAEEAGSYFLNAQALRKVKTLKDGKEVITEERDSVRSGVTIPYSPEFADLESNGPLLEKLRILTGGLIYQDDPEALAQAAQSGVLYRAGLPSSRGFQPIWHWLLLATGVLLFFDVAVRRIAIEPHGVAAASQRLWERLRRKAATAAETAQFIERLKTRKAQVDEALERTRATRRFEGEPAAEPPPGAEVSATPLTSQPPPPPMPQPKIAPENEPEAADYASRLMRAKKKVWEERGKDEK